MWSIIQAAGWPIWPLLFLSVLALTLIVERFMSLRHTVVCPPKLLDKVVQEYKTRGLSQELIDTTAAQGPLGHILAAGLAHARSPRPVVKEALEEAGSVVGHQLERFLNTLGTIAAAAPLLGLLGTVIGMIEIFGSNQAQGVNPTQLAQGISVALYNTAMGIIVAVPALMFYRYFRGKVDSLLVEMEQQALRMVNIIQGDRHK
jgi:biopolymer transport protein ExbB